MKENKAIVNRIEMFPITHQILKDTANARGMELGNFIGHFLDNIIMEGNKLNFAATPYSQAHWNWVTLKQQQILRERTWQAAAMYHESPTEESADMVDQMCDAADMDFDELMSATADNPFTKEVARARLEGPKFGRCLRWLPEFLAANGNMVPVTIIEKAADQAGYAMSMLRRVKKAVCKADDVPDIVSVRQSAGWAWTIVGLQGEQEEQEQDGVHNIIDDLAGDDPF